jgi:hypothetical protein
MNRTLRLHPDSHRKAANRIDVAVCRLLPGRLALRYVLTGTIGDIAFPAPAPSTRADALWRHSCFEIFVQRAASEAYCEFNFAPSGQWAAYGFESYRTGMVALDVAPPTITVDRDEGQFTLAVEFDLPPAFETPAWLALCAVIEDRDGTLSYWALNHPAGSPDFHHRDGFALELGDQS